MLQQQIIKNFVAINKRSKSKNYENNMKSRDSEKFIRFTEKHKNRDSIEDSRNQVDESFLSSDDDDA